jgi:hypothetical protein
LTTLHSYGEVGNQRQGEIIKALAKPQPTLEVDLKKLVREAVLEAQQSDYSG